MRSRTVTALTLLATLAITGGCAAPTDGDDVVEDTESEGSELARRPQPRTWVTIDGVRLTVDATTLWSKPGDYDVFIKVHGPGVPVGSDIVVSARRTGRGCDTTVNYITYRPRSAGETQYMPASAHEPACPLSIYEVPTAVGGRFRGSFHGPLFGINRSYHPNASYSKHVDLTFDVLRTP